MYFHFDNLYCTFLKLFILQAVGKRLWELLAKPPYNLRLTDTLMKVLEDYGFNRLCSFKSFDEAGIEKLELFMTKKLPKILEKKWEENKLDNPSKIQLLKQYYGDLFAYCPEEFELGGLKAELGQIAAVANTIYSDKKTPSMFNRNKAKASSTKPSPIAKSSVSKPTENKGNSQILFLFKKIKILKIQIFNCFVCFDIAF